MINITGISNSIFSGQNMMNSLRAYQALGSNYGKYQSGLSAVQSAQKYKSAALTKDQQGFLKSFQSSMSGMVTAAGKLKNPTANKLTAASSDSGVASVSGKLSKQTDRYTVKVDQLAARQVNRSNAMTAESGLPSLTGKLKLETGKGSFELSLSAAGASDNKGMLEKFAAKINEAGTGITASVKEKDGNISLELTGGDGQQFTASGRIADELGLGAVAQEAQGAVYTVAKNGGPEEELTSDSNSITLDGLNVTLKSAGTTEIASGTDAATAKADAMEELVNSFNKSLDFLNDNGDRGIGVLQQIKRMIVPPTSEQSMEKIGVSILKDGSLSFDRAKFTEAMKSSPTLVTSIADNMARGIQNDAQQGMRSSSASLLSTERAQQTQSANDSTLNPLNYLSSYSRSGIQSLMNYYSVGVLMNTLI